MKQEHVEKALNGFTTRRPFKPFLIELMSGNRLEIRHPEAVYFREEILVYRDPSGAFRLFDSDSVCQMLDADAG